MGKKPKDDYVELNFPTSDDNFPKPDLVQPEPQDLPAQSNPAVQALHNIAQQPMQQTEEAVTPPGIPEGNINFGQTTNNTSRWQNIKNTLGLK